MTVHPGLVLVDGEQKVLDWFARDHGLVNVFDNGSDLGGTMLGSGGLGMDHSASRLSNTEGCKYEEWILSPGQRVFVLGEASDEKGELAIVEPSLISTSSETELIDRKRSQQRLCTTGAATAGAGGFVLTVFSLL